jgi:hypothetical protein
MGTEASSTPFMVGVEPLLFPAHFGHRTEPSSALSIAGVRPPHRRLMPAALTSGRSRASGLCTQIPSTLAMADGALSLSPSGTHKLASEDGEELTNAWNIQQLRRFYP